MTLKRINNVFPLVNTRVSFPRIFSKQMSGTVTFGKVRLVDKNISDQIDSIEREQIAVSGRLTAVEQTIATPDSAALSNRVTTAEQEIEALEEEDVVLAIATSALLNRVTTAEKDISALEAKYVALVSATTAVSNRVTAAEQGIDALGGTGVTLSPADTLQD